MFANISSMNCCYVARLCWVPDYKIGCHFTYDIIADPQNIFHNVLRSSCAPDNPYGKKLLASTRFYGNASYIFLCAFSCVPASNNLCPSTVTILLLLVASYGELHILRDAKSEQLLGRVNRSVHGNQSGSLHSRYSFRISTDIVQAWVDPRLNL